MICTGSIQFMKHFRKSGIKKHLIKWKMKRNIKSNIGDKLVCKGWQQEAAYRMIQNNLDRNNAEDPDNLIVYGGIGKAARNWECFDAILNALKILENDETL